MARQAAARLVELGTELRLPLVTEELDSEARKAGLACGEHPRRARTLSSIACSTFAKALASAALRTGMHLSSMNPAFTGLIGRVSYAPRHG